MEASAFETLLTDIGSVIGFFFNRVPMVIDTIIASPVLTMFVVAIPVVGLAVGLFNRFIRSN